MEDEPTTIAEASFGLKIAQEHQGNSWLQGEAVVGHPIGVEAVDVFHRKTTGVTKIIHLISTVELDFLSRKLFYYHVVDPIHSLVGGGENGSTIQPIGILYVVLQLGEYLLSQLHQGA